MARDGGLVSAYDVKTGAPIYVQERLGAEGSYYASPVAAEGNIYFTSLEGVITVLFKKALSTREDGFAARWVFCAR